MPTIAASVIILWPSTNGTIPTGWARETGLDTKYPKGSAAACNPGDTGGTLTHSHTTQSHIHSGDHTHTVPNSPAASNTTARDTGAAMAPSLHTHDNNPNTVNPTASLAGNTPSTGSPNHEPPFRDVIFISSDGTPTGVPASGITFWGDSASIPTQWYLANGASGRIDLRLEFPKGASGSGDSGASGGATTHSHTIDSHTHSTPFSHNHPDVTSSQKTQGSNASDISGANAATATATHTHTLTIGTNTAAITGNTDTAGASSNQPLFRLMAMIQNDSGGLDLQDKIVGIWRGTLASIPSSWALCDGTGGTQDLRQYFIKGASVVGDTGGSGGGATHGHVATGHTHAVASHNHTVSAGQGASANRTAGAVNVSTGTHTHPSWQNAGATSFTSGNIVPIVDNFSNTEPPFVEVAFIQYSTAVVSGGQPLGVLQPMGIVW